MQPFPEAETIQKEVKEQFNNLIDALNTLDAPAWADHYSRDGFLSAVAGADRSATRREWVDTVTSYFATREQQQVEVLAVQVTPLAPDLALLTSQEKSKMLFTDGQRMQSAHVFTMIWKKEEGGWKILYSHESWVEK